MAHPSCFPHADPMTKPMIQPTNTNAFYAQAWISFAISFAAVLAGTVYLPMDGWVRAFMSLGVLYVVTSSLTLAKVIRDREESAKVISRVDDARMERLLVEHDPLRPLV